MAEHPAVNRRVAGSSPARGVFIWSVGQGVKTPPFHGGNAGSNPSAPAIFLKEKRFAIFNMAQ